jgi:hypothetical protein
MGLMGLMGFVGAGWVFALTSGWLELMRVSVWISRLEGRVEMGLWGCGVRGCRWECGGVGEFAV